MPRATILIAEDDPVLRNLYVKKFSSSGIDVKTAENGEEAIATITASPPDLLIADISMPKADGFEILKKFPKKDRKFVIIMVTNYEEESVRSHALELGADEFLTKKSITIRSLVELVERLLAEQRSQS